MKLPYKCVISTSLNFFEDPSPRKKPQIKNLLPCVFVIRGTVIKFGKITIEYVYKTEVLL